MDADSVRHGDFATAKGTGTVYRRPGTAEIYKDWESLKKFTKQLEDCQRQLTKTIETTASSPRS